jgi:hypothetical protein
MMQLVMSDADDGEGMGHGLDRQISIVEPDSFTRVRDRLEPRLCLAEGD